MAGLLEQGMTPGQVPGQATVPPPVQTPVQPPGQVPPTPGQAPQGATATGQSGDRLTFDEKEMEIFIANGVKLIHQEKISDMIIAQTAKAGDPIESLSNVLLNIVGKLEQSSEESGKQLSYVAMSVGANSLLGEIINIAEIGGMKKLDDQQKYAVYSRAIGKYLDNAVKSGKMTKEELAAMGEDMASSEQGQEIVNFDPKKNYKKSPKKEGA